MVAITLAVVLLAASTVVLAWYGRSQWHRSKHASFALEQTELLLGDVTEKHERMQQVWARDGWAHPHASLYAWVWVGGSVQWSGCGCAREWMGVVYGMCVVFGVHRVAWWE